MTNSSKKVSVRRAGERGHFNYGWLETYHTFSFGDYQDPLHRHFRTMRVINDDVIQAGQGFGTHPHRDMEILTYVIDGELKHKDSMGNGSIIKAGELQKMSAGTGITHSEFNPNPEKPARLLQIWIFPDTKGLTPAYQQIPGHELPETAPGLRLAASKEGKNCIQLHQDAAVLHGKWTNPAAHEYSIEEGRGIWIQMISGELNAAGVTLKTGDGLSVENQESVFLDCKAGAEFLLFDLA